MKIIITEPAAPLGPSFACGFGGPVRLTVTTSIMIDLNDNIWPTLEGGYKTKFDASVPLKKMEECSSPSKEIWETLWEELHHQGNVGIASYAVLPHLIRIYKEKRWFEHNLCMFASIIERARLQNSNPDVPEWLEKEYRQSLDEIVKYSVEHIEKKWDYYSLLGLLMLISLLQDNFELAELLNLIDEGQAKTFIEKIVS